MALTTVVFDWDGTLLDSDQALIEPFLALGVAREDISFGHVVHEECTRLGIDAQAYLDGYDPTVPQPWPGVPELVGALTERAVRWAVVSNKHPQAGRAELERLGWAPEAVHWSDRFAGRSKELGPVLDELAVPADEVLYVGDTEHDRAAARAVDVAFAVAGWNPRAASVRGGALLREPGEVLGLVG